MSLLEVIDESFCLNDPAAAFLELIKADPPSLLIFAINDLSSGVGFFKNLRRLSNSSSFFLFLLSVNMFIRYINSIGKYGADCLADDSSKDGCSDMYRMLSQISRAKDENRSKYEYENNLLLNDFNHNKIKQAANAHYKSYT